MATVTVTENQAEQKRPSKDFELTGRQSLAFQILFDLLLSAVRLLYGGAKGGGKSFFGCLWVVKWSHWLIKFFDIKPSDNPPAIGFMGRKRSVDFTMTTLETFKRIIPASIYRINEQKKEIILWDRVKVYYGGLDDQETINKFNSMELCFFFIDQAEETERGDLTELKASLRFKYNGKQPPYRELYTANPAECWLKQDFIKGGGGETYYFVPALPSDNPHLPSDYDGTLEIACKGDPALLAAYRDGDWDALAQTNVLITDVMLEGLKGITHNRHYLKRVVACDPSEGGDECVIKVFENEREIEQLILHYKDAVKIAHEIDMMLLKHDAWAFCVDVIGNDVYDIVSDMTRARGVKGIPINSAEKENVSPKFFNRRAEIWWYVARTMILNKEVHEIEDEQTRGQLMSVYYSIVDSSGTVKLESKQQTKKRLKGRSPDRGDCYVYGIWALQFVEDVNKFKKKLAMASRPGRYNRVSKYEPVNVWAV